MFAEEEDEVSGKAVECYPEKLTLVGALFIAPATPHQGLLMLPIEAFFFFLINLFI